MNDTSVWVPISSAVAALLGGAVGAMFQGRYGVTGWRRQIRMEAYTKLLDASHDFDSLLFNILHKTDGSDFAKRQRELEECYSRLQSVGTLVAIAGPKEIDIALAYLLNNANSVVKDVRNRDILLSIVHDLEQGKSYGNWRAWLVGAQGFTDTARRILRTE